MSELIPSITLSVFKKLKADQLKRLKSCEVTADGEYLFTFVRAQTDYVRTQTEYLSQTSNTIGGKTLEEVTELVPSKV